MPCGRKYKRIRAKDVGRPGFHYVKFGILAGVGPRGGRTERIGELRKYKSHRSRKVDTDSLLREIKSLRMDFRKHAKRRKRGGYIWG